MIAFFVLGMAVGLAAKHLDGISLPPFNVLGLLSSRIGIWVFIAAIIASWSPTPRVGAGRVFVFLTGVLLTYYAYSMKMFGFFPLYYCLRWGLIALVSPLCAYVVWLGKGQGWTAALCAALPIGLLAAQGYSFFYTGSAVPGFDLVAAIVLFFALPVQRRQYSKVPPLAFIVALLVVRSDILAHALGGL